MDSKQGDGSPPALASKVLETRDRRERARLAQEGLRKLKAGEKLNREERRAVTEVEREQLETYGSQYVANCPKQDYCDNVGIHRRVALDQSRRFGLAYHTSGKTINLWAQLAAWHQWASENKHLITRVIKAQQAAEILDEDDTLDFWQRELVKERTLKERDGRLDRERQNLPRELVHALLQEFYVEPHVRRLEQLERRDEPISPQEASSWYRQDLQAFEQAIEALFGDDSEMSGAEAAD